MFRESFLGVPLMLKCKFWVSSSLLRIPFRKLNRNTWMHCNIVNFSDCKANSKTPFNIGICSTFNFQSSVFFFSFLWLWWQMGYASPSPLTSGIHTRLYSRAFVIEDDTNRVVFVSVDVGMIDQSVKTEVWIVAIHSIRKWRVCVVYVREKKRLVGNLFFYEEIKEENARVAGRLGREN